MANTLSNALEFAVRTDPGLVRRKNEDSTFADPSHGLFILADGMGGYDAGEVASQMATSLLSSKLQGIFQLHPEYATDYKGEQSFLQRTLVANVALINAAIYDASDHGSPFFGMGTTLLTTIFCDDHVLSAHVGDSRLYRLRNDELSLLTHDHSLVQERLDGGLISPEAARCADYRNLLTRAVGIDRQVEPELHVHQTEPGDVYLLCSDGLYDMVEETEMHRTLITHAGDLVATAGTLIELANEYGGEDNISVLLVKVVQNFPAPPKAWSKLCAWF